MNTQTIRQTVKNFHPTEGEIRKFRKESAFYKSLQLLDLSRASHSEHYHVLGQVNVPATVDCRWYATASRIYCCVWIQSETLHVRGGGFAGGYGYCKMSTAFEAAMRAAGVEFSRGIAGVGEVGVGEALQALALHLGLSNFALVDSHA